MSIDAVLLCGGQGSRLGGLDKGLQPWQGQALVEHALAACAAWPLGQMWISANRNLDHYRAYGRPVLPDLRAGFQGPLAGIEAALSASDADYLLVLPCDMGPYPASLLESLLAALDAASPVAWAADAERAHPAVCLLRRSQLALLSARLDAGQRGVMRWQQAVGGCEVRLAQPLVNRNTPDQLDAPG